MRLALVLVCAFGAWAQSGNLGSGTAERDGVRFLWDTRVEPALPRPSFDSLGANLPDGWVAKAMLDRTARVYFGYQFKVSRAEGGARVEFRALQLTAELAASLRMENPSSWKTWAVQVPPPQIIRELDWISIELMTNPSTGQKIIEYVTISKNLGVPPEVFRLRNEPREFRVEDAALHLRGVGVTITKEDTASRFESVAEVRSPVVWLRIPSRGRYLLSLIPRAGFNRIGQVSGTTGRFTIDGETFEIGSAVRIAPGDGNFHLWIKQDNWRRDSASFEIGVERP